MTNTNNLEIIHIFTDGACKGNPGPGGWGALLRYKGQEKTLKGSEAHTTNNRMELMAVISALAILKRTSTVAVTTDSQYVKKGISEWLPKWKQNNWQNSKKEPVKNADLWKLLEIEAQKHQISWHWVRGHTGHLENTLADALANEAIEELMKKKV